MPGSTSQGLRLLQYRVLRLPGPGGGVMRATAFILAAVAAATAYADSCTDRSGNCAAACTPRQVQSGAQFGGTVPACRASCQSRLRSCLKTGIWIHMDAARRGEQEPVDQQ